LLLNYNMIFRFLFLFATVCGFAQKNATPFEIEGINKNGVFGLTISPDGKEAFWVNSNGGRDTLAIMQSKKVNEKWQKPEIAKFSENLTWKNIDPMFSPDGKTLLFQSNRPVEGKSDRKRFDIWAVKKVNNGWSQEYHLGNTINTDDSESFASMTKDGSVYFMKENPDGKGKSDIYVSRFVKGEFQTPINIGIPINTIERESNPFIAPDESFILYFTTKPEGSFGEIDLLISFNENGKWSEPKNLGSKINTTLAEFCPFYHKKEKRLYFSRQKNLPNKRMEENLFFIDFDPKDYKNK